VASAATSAASTLHYGDDPGVKFYTHLSDRYAPFHTKVIGATASESRACAR
jgi:TnpA family transposase